MRSGEGYELDHSRVQGVGRIGGGGTAFDVVDATALVGDNQRALELPHVLGVDAEVGLDRHLHVHPLGHVDERAARPDRGVKRGELVVCERDHGAEPISDYLRVLTQPTVHVEEDDALLLQILAYAMVYCFRLVLCCHS